MPLIGPPADPVPDFPVDPDLPGMQQGPMHLGPGPIGLVLAGGAVGGPLRYAITQLWATPTGGFPWSTFTVNASGAFALGLLLEGLARAGPDTGGRRAVRLLLGTGVLGAYTTFSALAVEADLLVHADRTGLAAAYAVGTLGAGLIACLAGALAGAAGHRALTRAPAPRTTGDFPTDVPDPLDEHR